MLVALMIYKLMDSGKRPGKYIPIRVLYRFILVIYFDV